MATGQQTLEQVILVLDAKIDGFQAAMKEASKAQKEAADKMGDSAKGMTSSIEGAAQSFLEFKNKVLLAAGIGGIGAFIKSSFEAADEIGALSQRIGVSTKFLQEMQFAASQLNVDQQILNQSLQIFTRTLGQATVGEEASMKAFKQLGISITDASGNAKSAEQVFGEVSDKFRDIESQAVRAAIANDLFGRSGGQMTLILAQGSAELAKFAQKANDLGLVIEDRLIQSADETNDKLATLGKVIQSQLASAVLELAPAIQGMVDGFISAAVVTRDLSQEVGAFIRSVSGSETATDKLQILQEKLGNLQKWQAPVWQIQETEKAIDALIKKEFALDEAKQRKIATSQAEYEIAKKNDELQKQAEEIIKRTQGSDKEEKLNAEIDLLKKAREQGLIIETDYQAAVQQLEADREAMQVEQTEREIDSLIAKIEAMRALNDEAYQAEIDANMNKVNQLMGQENAFSEHYLKTKNRLKQIDEKSKQEEKKRDDQMVRDRTDSLNWISNLQHSKSKEMAAVGKAAAIANTTITTYEAAMKAYSSLAGIPIIGPALGAAAAAAAVSVGLSRVASIAGTDIGFKTGADMIPGLGLGDSVPAMIQPGERIVRTDTNRVLEQFLRDYRDNSGGGVGGEVRLEIVMNDNLMDFIETQLVARGRVNVSINQ
jgi:hypothetical protein